MKKKLERKRNLKVKKKKAFKRKKEGRFKRAYKPRCYVCHRVLQDLIDLKWHVDNDMTYSDAYERLKKRVNDTLIRLFDRGVERFRHNRASCEVGGKYYMKNEELVTNFIKNHGMSPERKEDMTLAVEDKPKRKPKRKFRRRKK
jgi:hypothetical protein